MIFVCTKIVKKLNDASQVKSNKFIEKRPPAHNSQYTTKYKHIKVVLCPTKRSKYM